MGFYMNIFTYMIFAGIGFFSVYTCSGMNNSVSLDEQIRQYRARHHQTVRNIEESGVRQVTQNDNVKLQKEQCKILSDHCKTLILMLSTPELSNNKEQIKQLIESQVACLESEIKQEKRKSTRRKKVLKTLKTNKRKLEASIDEQDLECINESLKKYKIDDENEQFDDEMID